MFPANPLRVAVGVIRNPQGEVLISQRASHLHQGGRWEFPGGKIEPGETTAHALRRELAEELGVTVASSTPLIRIPHDYGDRAVVLEVETVTDYVGLPQGMEGQPLQWLQPEAMDPANFPAANRPIITALQLPQHYVISPDCEDGSTWLAGLSQVLAAGERLIQFRVRGTSQARAALAREALKRCHAGSASLLINADWRLAESIGADGVHLNAAQLRSLTQRPLSEDMWVGASCHNAEELALAAALGVDFALLSPVAATASHPQQPPIGWPQFAQWVAEAAVPVYALGGMRREDVEMACRQGGQGVAGISGFWPV